jgi:paraquat-inducible protein B
MSKRANPKIVGGFVLGAIALAIAGAAAFGSGALLRPRPQAVTFFGGSVAGLIEGAPVNLRGVRVGSVKDIRLNVEMTDLSVQIAVYLEFEPERLEAIGGPRRTGVLGEAIERGLKAQLVSQSFVTGQLAVELAYRPDVPVKFVGLDKSMVEIPTVISEMESVKEFLGRLPLDEMANAAIRSLKSIDHLVSSPDLQNLITLLAADAQEIKRLVETMHDVVPPISGSIRDTSSSARDTLLLTQRLLSAVAADVQSVLGRADQTLTTADTQIATLGASGAAALKSAEQTARQAEGQIASLGARSGAAVKNVEQAAQQAEIALASVNTLISRGTIQRGDIDLTLRNLSTLTASLRSLADQLERNPQILLTGRKQ